MRVEWARAASAALLGAGFALLIGGGLPGCVPDPAQLHIAEDFSPSEAAFIYTPPLRRSIFLGAPDLDDLHGISYRLRPLHSELGPPRRGEWRSIVRQSPQSFRHYVAGAPVRPDPRRKTIYFMAIDSIEPRQQAVAELTREFVGLYFGLPVSEMAPYPVTAAWPEWARRRRPGGGGAQLDAEYILYGVLMPWVLDDAVALVALTSWDIWPGEGWSYAFGFASLRDRIGVYSMYRNGPLRGSQRDFRRFLRRTLKTAVHELGHMFSMEHCMEYHCAMCGTNGLDESDRYPLYMCPTCMAKLAYAIGFDPLERYAELEAWCRRNGLSREAAYYAKAYERLVDGLQ